MKTAMGRTLTPTQEAPKSAGWYLALRYMQGTGFIARASEVLPPEDFGAQFIFSDDVLLTASNWREVLLNWWTSLANDGYLILWLQDCRHNASDQKTHVTLHDVEHALDEIPGWQLLESDLIDGHAFVVWKKRNDYAQYRTPWRKQPHHVLVRRTGAYGDALMASSVLPHLKEQGWCVSFVTRRSGAEVLRHDPHIDELILLAEGQVSDHELPYYWQALAQRFDRFINLTHSVEGELLKQPWRGDYHWSDTQRRALCNRSYLEQIHALAEAPRPYRVKFYPSAKEEAFAKNFVEENGAFILWCLRGSAVHKWWPHAPQAICQLLSRTSLHFVLTGDSDAQPLCDSIFSAVKDFYGDTGRLHSFVGTHSIRETMALAQRAQIVIGPETGVLHAVSFEPLSKICLLSHSSPKNLTDDWIATTALHPPALCHPCHRLHYSHEWCPQDETTGAACCAASIPVFAVVDAVMKHLKPNSPTNLKP